VFIIEDWWKEWGMKRPRLTSIFVPASESEVRDSLSEVVRLDPVEPSSPEAKQQVAEGGLCIIPAQGGCVAVTADDGLARAIEELPFPTELAR
jgi:hypothetical protein